MSRFKRYSTTLIIFRMTLIILIPYTILQRFGSALTPDGLLHLSKKTYEKDYQPIDKECKCSTCANYTRAYLHSIIHEPVSCSLITVHNVAYQVGNQTFHVQITTCVSELVNSNCQIITCVCETLMHHIGNNVAVVRFYMHF